ncbi:TetR/AcrR family transcriptional regulator [Aetokthonos hydrillicola Thurmond2011]|jgi:AcrR family transcriptional regulator|uniref:TetR/AcrR family transcriptional regulator n=1 Tax=Aetokthonos hydrillicola Thurmond2011 TaxID=2712845 RepID=A0AAP5MAJ8_9CYAN|nr:TetR/AcrR family transcriptional regulator [Aetokthonos hydrillicola]MBO3462567.1 TetR/AcrR family transcriptional regulator [Aetokthonos hydrillicola CCALA 1050]MBW4590355.1 TetR/AcrR family transcriptional regulator [Aetokthonos hydrillicola CCALA 1050]MDR9896897.1 TetR/AcrR family transcriptional regulator [Aetokthonos hydrillicola Thurmond2011]
MSQLLENTIIPTKALAKAPLKSRRNERSHKAILTAAVELLQEKGYRDICIEALASRAGVGKQTIYRWWSSKAEVIMEAYSAIVTEDIPAPDTGSIKQDLCQILLQLFAILTTTTTGKALTGLIAEAQMDASLASSFRKQFIECRTAATRTILERGVARGELRSDSNLDLVIDAIYGPIWYRLLLKHGTLDDAFAEELVNFVILGVQA